MKWETFWRRWKQTARKIGEFQARVLLSAFYFLILAPFALVFRRKHRFFSGSAAPSWLPVAAGTRPSAWPSTGQAEDLVRQAAESSAARNQS